MEDMQFLFDSGFSMLAYMVPTIFVLMSIIFADVILAFLIKILVNARKHVRF